MELFHITEERNVPFILIQGIIPLKKHGLMRNWPVHERPDVVWLTNSTDFVYNTQVGQRHGYVTIKVNVDGLDIEPATCPSYFEGRDERIVLPNEFWHRGIIGPDRLTIV